ncbi:MAG: hypothetical protein WAK50_05605 [Nitrososphaeraceae archaeon]
MSDILPSGCLRKQYYGRKDRTDDVLSEDTIYHFVRGESSERIITELADMGIAQCKIEHKGIVARPDILKKGPEISPANFLVIELKDNATLGKRLEPDDYTFKSYLNQLLYYLVITDVENGILCIKYSTPELIWYERDSQGVHYLKPSNAKVPGIESWAVYLSTDDPLREELEQEMLQRKDLFLEALRTSKVEILPRLRGFQKKLKCRRCSFMEKCWSQDSETVEAMQLADELSIIDRITEVYTD